METKNIYQKLFEAKKEIGKISKDSTNPFFKSKYFDINGLLDAVEPILTKHNLLLLQPIENGQVMTVIYNIDDPKEMVSSFIELPNITEPQKLGSAITYYRRYTLQSLLGLQAEDDDANLASKATKTTQEPSKRWLNEKDIEQAIEWLNTNHKQPKDLYTHYSISKDVFKIIEDKFKV